MNPTTWGEAADIELQYLERRAAGLQKGFMSWEEAYGEDWSYLMAMALNRLEEAHVWDREVFLRMLVGKQRDYGPRNILKFGSQGVSVRLWDKISRLQNLDTQDRAPQNESIVDTLMDIIGYVVVDYMLSDDWFRLPVEVSEVKLSPEQHMAKLAGRCL